MKAIDTQYRGYRFRSRLEARWAVFLDAMDVRWTYEEQGYDLGDGVRYLPDFTLGNYAFLEIKPWNERDPNLWTDKEKWVRLSQQSDRDVFVAFGQPGEGDWSGRSVGVGLWVQPHQTGWEAFAFLECRKCSRLSVASLDGHYALLECREDCKTDRHPIAHDTIAAANDAARSARFEHGQTMVQPSLVPRPKPLRVVSPEEAELRERLEQLDRRIVESLGDSAALDALIREKKEVAARFMEITRKRWRR